MHIFAGLARRARTEPDAVFCHFLRQGGHRVVGVGEVMAAATAFAAALQAAGVAAGTIVPIVLEHRVALYSSFIGATLLGAAPTLLPPLTHKQHAASWRASMQALLARIGPPCIVVSQATRPMLGDDAGWRCVDVDATAADIEAAAIAVPLQAEPQALACLQHSSGTTGLKKGVCLSHGAVWAQARAYAAAIRLTPADRVASWLPLYHDMGLMTAFLMPAMLGVPVVSLDALEWSAQPALLLDAIERFSATLCWLPNFAFHHIARTAPAERRWDLSSLRLAVNCSEPCRAAAFDAFAERFGVTQALQASYAMAETVFAATQTPPAQAVRRSPLPDHAEYVSSGRPIEGVTIEVRDQPGRALPERVLGEIHLRAPFLFDGYFRQPELGAARLRDGWYSTGDLGFLDAGELFVIGRADDVLNLNGRKIVAHEVEDALSAVAGLAPGRVLVFAEHDGQSGGARLAVAAERDGSAVRTDDELAADIRRAVMASCAAPPHVVLLLERGTLEKSSSGKLARAASLTRLKDRERWLPE